MKNWKGVFIIGIAIIHTLFAIISFGAVYLEMFENGFINSISSPRAAIASWFFLFGILLLALGMMVYIFEKKSIQIPKNIALTLLTLAILGAAIMPASGFWLLFPPVLAMLLNSTNE